MDPQEVGRGHGQEQVQQVNLNVVMNLKIP
jgi:hypothetical protein